MAQAQVCFLLVLFAIIPVLFAGCPEGKCCPVGDNCDVNSDLCKPNSTKDCQKGKYFHYACRGIQKVDFRYSDDIHIV